MRIKIFLLLVLVSALPASGCMLNAHTGARYYQWGMEAEKAGDLNLARQNYSRSYANAQMGHLGPAAEAYSLYEWSRVTGYLGMHADAEKGFRRVLELIDGSEAKAEGLRAPALSELARLLHDTGQHEKAVPVYRQTVEKFDGLDITAKDPLGYAIVLDDYAESLRAAGDAAAADTVAKRSLSIKEANQGSVPKFIGKRYN